jgi:hypothetical protein
MLGHNYTYNRTAFSTVIQTRQTFSIMWLQQGCY